MLKWAYKEGANITEPIDALKESGWNYGDIPTSSNFNWLFKTTADSLDELHGKHKLELKSLSETILKQSLELAELKKKAEQDRVAMSHFNRALSRVLFILNHNNLLTGLKSDYPFDEDPISPNPIRTPPRSTVDLTCHRCGEIHVGSCSRREPDSPIEPINPRNPLINPREGG